jgi:hypothetical protein
MCVWFYMCIYIFIYLVYNFYYFFVMGAHYIARLVSNSLTQVTFLPQLPQCWDYRCIPQCLNYILKQK